MKARRTSGYSEEVASVYVSKDTDVVLLSTKPEPQVKWENHKPTDEITGYRVLCGMPDNYFYVKFDKRLSCHLLNSVLSLSTCKPVK